MDLFSQALEAELEADERARLELELAMSEPQVIYICTYIPLCTYLYIVYMYVFMYSLINLYQGGRASEDGVGAGRAPAGLSYTIYIAT